MSLERSAIRETDGPSVITAAHPYPTTGSRMDGSNDHEPTQLYRRTFVRRGMAGALGVGLLGQNDSQQDNGEGEAQIRRKFLLQRVARFEQDEPANDYVGRGLLVTTKANVESQPKGEFDCEFPDWDPESFVKYQVLLFDLNQGVITESRAFISESSDPIPAGTPYLINVEVPCSGRYVGVEGEHIPSRLVE